MHVSELTLYPLKSAAGRSVAASEVGSRGLEDDRRWMLVDEFGRFVSQREQPRLALLRAAQTADGLRLALPGGEVREVSRPPAGARSIAVEIWGSRLEAPEGDAEVAGWLGRWLGVELRLVYMPEALRRAVNPDRSQPGDIVSFADGYPVMITNEASLQALNGQLADNLEMARFRPNVVVAGALDPWAEDRWGRLRLGAVELQVSHGCQRCQVTTIDPGQGRFVGKEPLSTLAHTRKIGKKVYFGVNAIVRVPGRLRVGDSVEVLGERSTAP